MSPQRVFFGDDFLCYVLACDIETLDTQSWTTVQRDILSELAGIQGFLETESVFARIHRLATIAASWNADERCTVANSWRRRCGGVVADYSGEEDICLALLLQMARDSYAGLLFSNHYAKSNPVRAGGTGTVLTHPVCDEFLRTVLADAQLKYLFPSVVGQEHAGKNLNELLDVSTTVVFAHGVGGGLQLTVLPDLLISSAFDRAQLSGDCSLASLVESLKETLDLARLLSAGRAASVPCVVALGNIEFQSEVGVDLPWGKLRRYRESDGRFFLARTGTTVDAVLETALPEKISKIQGDDDSTNRLLDAMRSNQRRFEQWDRDLQRKVNLTRLALALASDLETIPAPTFISTVVLSPFASVPTERYRPSGIPYTSRIAVVESSYVAIQQWGERLQAQHPKSLDVSMTRVIAALCERLDPLDGFIDAVMSWENMFSGTPETSLRTCGSIAILVEPDNIEQRLDTFENLKKLYDLRSRIVHGAADELSLSESEAKRKEAIRVALEALRKLHTDRPDLLGKDSANRSKRLLLGL